MTAQRWPAAADIIDEMLAAARSYTLEQDLHHPEDIASALINALDVVHRMVKPL